MKSTTFYRLMLGLPYLFLIPGWFALGDFVRSLSAEGPTAPSNLLITFWGITSLFWIIPYTIFAIGLFIWSIGKTKEIIRIWYSRSPLILGILSPFFFLLLSPIQSRVTDTNIAGTLGSYICIGTACSMPLSLIYGFIFVGTGFVLHSIGISTGFIKD